MDDEFRRIEQRLATAGVQNPAAHMRRSDLGLRAIEDTLDVWISERMKHGDRIRPGLIVYVLQTAGEGDDVAQYFPDRKPPDPPKPSRVEQMTRERLKQRERQWIGDDGPTMLERFRELLAAKGLPTDGS